MKKSILLVCALMAHEAYPGNDQGVSAWGWVRATVSSLGGATSRVFMRSRNSSDAHSSFGRIGFDEDTSQTRFPRTTSFGDEVRVSSPEGSPRNQQDSEQDGSTHAMFQGGDPSERISLDDVQEKTMEQVQKERNDAQSQLKRLKKIQVVVTGVGVLAAVGAYLYGAQVGRAAGFAQGRSQGLEDIDRISQEGFARGVSHGAQRAQQAAQSYVLNQSIYWREQGRLAGRSEQSMLPNPRAFYDQACDVVARVTSGR